MKSKNSSTSCAYLRKQQKDIKHLKERLEGKTPSKHLWFFLSTRTTEMQPNIVCYIFLKGSWPAAPANICIFQSVGHYPRYTSRDLKHESHISLANVQCRKTCFDFPSPLYTFNTYYTEWLFFLCSQSQASLTQSYSAKTSYLPWTSSFIPGFH